MKILEETLNSWFKPEKRHLNDHRGETKMQNFEKMSGPELIAAYNEMARSIEGGALGAREIKRFASREIGIKRYKALAEAITVRVNELEVSTEPKSADNDAFPARGNSLRTRLFNAMMDNIGRQVPTPELVDKLYGTTRSDAGALGGVMKGVTEVIRKNALGYTIRKQKNGREVSYGLYEKEDQVL